MNSVNFHKNTKLFVDSTIYYYLCKINNKTVVKIVNRPWDIINWTSWITKFLNL